MVSVVASVRAEQRNGSTLRGVVRSPLPALSAGTWVENSKLANAYTTIGEDSSAVYVRLTADSGGSDSDVYRIDTTTGADEQITGSAVGRAYGNTYLALPLGDLDVILFGRDAIARIQGGNELWQISLSGQTGFPLADAAVVTGSSVYVIYQHADFSNFRPIDYQLFSFSVTAPPSSSNTATWTTYPIDWDAIDVGGDPAPLSSGVIAALAPSIDYGVAVLQVRSGDGWGQEGHYVLTGVFEDGGLPTVSHYGNVDVGMGNKLSQITTNVDISGGEIVGAMVAQTPLASSTSDIPLPALDPGYDTWTVSEFFGFGVSFDPPAETPPFWTNLRRAAEQI